MNERFPSLQMCNSDINSPSQSKSLSRQSVSNRPYMDYTKQGGRTNGQDSRVQLIVGYIPLILVPSNNNTAGKGSAFILMAVSLY
jgi:hypothetical protein